MKQEFIDFLNALMEASPDIVAEKMTDNVKMYIEAIKEDVENNPVLTENGKIVLQFLQNHPETLVWKSKQIFDLGVEIPTSRGVSGALRKLVSDGFCEKIGKDPVIYSLTEKGKNFKIEQGEN